MAILRAAKATVLFELARNLTPGRIAASAVLALFPPAMLALIMFASNGIRSGEFPLIILVYMVILLSLLLWASPVIYAELEGRTYIYLASRPGGRISTMLGKYVVAVVWSFGVAWIAMTLCLIINEQWFPNPKQTFRYWMVFTMLIAMACTVYGSVFVMIGSIFHRRAMVFCAGYTLLSEVWLSSLPAIISRFTVRFHLHSFAEAMLDWRWLEGTPFQEIFDAQPIWMDLLMLSAITLFTMGVTIFSLRTREYLTVDEA